MTLLNYKKEKGFTLVEMLVVIAISALVFALTVSAFVTLSDYQSLDKTADVALSYAETARQQAIDSKNYSEYGIHFATTSVTLFQGTSYVAGSSTNLVYTFSPKAAISVISLSNNGSSLYFNKISGEPNATGTITFKSYGNASTTKTMIIYGTGLSEIQ